MGNKSSEKDFNIQKIRSLSEPYTAYQNCLNNFFSTQYIPSVQGIWLNQAQATDGVLSFYRKFHSSFLIDVTSPTLRLPHPSVTSKSLYGLFDVPLTLQFLLNPWTIIAMISGFSTGTNSASLVFFNSLRSLIFITWIKRNKDLHGISGLLTFLLL